MSELFDFAIVSGNQKVKMSELKGSEIEFNSLQNISYIKRHDKKIKIIHHGKDFNHKYLNIRTSTISIDPTYIVFNEYTKKIEKDSYEITIGDFDIDDGVILQIFYKHHWFGTILGDKEKIVSDFSSTFKNNREENSEAQKSYDQIIGVYEIILQNSNTDKNKFLKMQLKSQIDSFIDIYPNSDHISELKRIKGIF